ncbi:cytochrome c oxidase assembly protein [Cellvibrio sp. OA-2007]|uniref:cytochrome c oxidase assembly protein n=1 Tax=Cellvibrio sp. OA-2007 TaxID=529823 RepID=UPI000781F7A8|nr:cytochrome c oxidase assembly protein [Cellvibrio sp. OA-2007]
MVSHKLLIRKLVLICIAMFGFGFALVPLYDVFCRYTGINGKTENTAAPASRRVDASREISVEFLANLDPGIAWSFAPEIVSVSVHPGQVKIVNFLAENLTDKAMIGRAVPSVSPGEAARYFKKIECFCFVEQPLDAHQAKFMPVQFYIDPELPSHFTTITLSYRLYNNTPRTAGR